MIKHNNIVMLLSKMLKPDLLKHVNYYIRNNNLITTLNNSKKELCMTVHCVDSAMTKRRIENSGNVLVGGVLEIIMMYLNSVILKTNLSKPTLNQVGKDVICPHYPCDIFTAIFSNYDLECLFGSLILKPYYDAFKKELLLLGMPQELNNIFMGF